MVVPTSGWSRRAGPAALWSALSLAACVLLYDEYEPPPAREPAASGADADVAPTDSPVAGGSPDGGRRRDPPDAGGLPDAGARGVVAPDAGVSGCAGPGCDAGAGCPGAPGCPDGGRGALGGCGADGCAPGAACERDADCMSRACQDGRCCGGRLGDCTRCAERLSLSVDCEAPPLGLAPSDVSDCRAFLACLAEHDEPCTTLGAPGCSGDAPAAACSEQDFGGRTGAGVSRATRVLQSAGCQL